MLIDDADVRFIFGVTAVLCVATIALMAGALT